MATAGPSSSSDSDSGSEADVDPRNNIVGYQFEPEWESGEENVTGDYSDSESDPEEPVVGREGNTNWCQCARCQITTLTRAKEHTCCCEYPGMKDVIMEMGLQCVTQHGDFDALCLHPAVLTNVLVCLNNVRVDHWQIRPPTNRSLRWAAYRQFTWWVHGHLGRDVRRVIPACAIHLIREAFPNPAGEDYVPYASDPED